MSGRAPATAVVAAVAVLLATACTGGGPPAPARLVLAAGPAGEVPAVLAAALAGAAEREWSAPVRVVETRGPVENIQLVAEGEADVAFTTVDLAARASGGIVPFGRALPIQAVARLYDNYLHLVTLAGSNVVTLTDLAGRRVGVTVGNLVDTDLPGLVLAAAGVAREDRVAVAAGRAGEALVRGEIDAFLVAGGLPTPAVARLADQADLRLVTLPELATELATVHGEYYRVRSVPAGTYSDHPEVVTASVAVIMVVRADLPEETGFQLTELLFGAKPELVAAHQEARRLDPRTALVTVPVALHPGAARYYRDTKPYA